MRQFKNIDEVEAWLEPMGYQGFWVAIAPYALILQPRDHCDRQIASGEADEQTVLSVLKSIAVMELTERCDLQRKIPTPWLQLVATN